MATGLVFIHHVPSALVSHIEWTVAGLSGTPTSINWLPAESKEFGYRGISPWSGPEDGGAVLATALMNLKQITFEITQDYAFGGYRWSFTPRLGLFQSATDAAGNLVIGENQIRLAMERAGSNPLKIQAELRKLLGQEFDDELEKYREVALAGAEGNDGVMPTESERVTYSKNI